MDSAMIDHLKITPEAAIGEIKDLINQVKIHGGEAIGIWHNYSLCEKDQYKGWREVLISILEHYQQTLK
jgi:chitinase